MALPSWRIGRLQISAARGKFSNAGRGRSLFNLGFLGGGKRIPLTFENHPLGSDKSTTVQAKVTSGACSSLMRPTRFYFLQFKFLF